MYHYFYSKGFTCIVCSKLIELLTVAFMIFFTTFLVVFIDWDSILHCNDLECTDVRAIRPNAIHNLSHFQKGVLFLESAFCIYWIVLIIRFLASLRRYRQMKHFFNKELHISERDIQTAEWSDVLARVVQLQDRRRLCLVRKLSEHDIVNRIMRRENYLIAMVNKGVLRLDVPLLTRMFSYCGLAGGTHSASSASSDNSPDMMSLDNSQFLHPNNPSSGANPAAAGGIRSNRPKKLHTYPVMTKTLEWNLTFILSSIFDDSFNIKRTYLQNPNQLKHQFIWFGCLNLLVSPFLLFFLAIFFVFRYTMELREHPGSFFALRKWSPYALWKFREFNELQHVFERRMKASYPSSVKYCEQFPFHLGSVLARFLLFVVGGFAATILFVSFVNGPLLLYSTIWGQNLYWYLGIFGVVLAAGRNMLVQESEVLDPHKYMHEVAVHTHYLPRRWRGRAHTYDVRDEFLQLFQYRIVLFLQEMASVLLTPVIFLVALPQCADEIVDFLKDSTVKVEGVGEICSMANFDVQKHGNARYGAPSDGRKALRSRHGKLENSCASFKVAYPSWQPPADTGASQLLSNLAFQYERAHAPSQYLMERARTGLMRMSSQVTPPAPSQPQQQQQQLLAVQEEQQQQQQQHIIHDNNFPSPSVSNSTAILQANLLVSPNMMASITPSALQQQQQQQDHLQDPFGAAAVLPPAQVSGWSGIPPPSATMPPALPLAPSSSIFPQQLRVSIPQREMEVSFMSQSHGSEGIELDVMRSQNQASSSYYSSSSLSRSSMSSTDVFPTINAFYDSHRRRHNEA